LIDHNNARNKGGRQGERRVGKGRRRKEEGRGKKIALTIILKISG